MPAFFPHSGRKIWTCSKSSRLGVLRDVIIEMIHMSVERDAKDHFSRICCGSSKVWLGSRAPYSSLSQRRCDGVDPCPDPPNIMSRLVCQPTPNFRATLLLQYMAQTFCTKVRVPVWVLTVKQGKDGNQTLDRQCFHSRRPVNILGYRPNGTPFFSSTVCHFT